MPIPLSCQCGRSLRVKDEFAGRKVKCPSCAAVLAVPKPEPEPVPSEEDEAYNVLSEDSGEEARPRSGKYQPDPEEMVQTAPRPSRRRGDEEEEEPERSRREERRREEEREERRRAERRREERRREEDREERRRASSRSSSGGGFGVNAGIGGGIVMILIAVVWFVGGLALGRLFFYPPILFVLGIIAIVKGFSDR
jgi:hypothetical protein